MQGDNINQPQVEEVKVEAQSEDTQAEVIPEPEQLGAEEKPQEVEPPKAEQPRTYSQEEWSERESKKDTEIAQSRNQLAQLNLQTEIFRAEQAEREATTRDQKEIDDGSLTTAEAEKRRDVRTQQRQTTETLARQQQTLRQMSQQTEQYGRVLAAQDFGKEYELTSEQITELLNDKDVRTPGDMKAKAANLALERVWGELKKVKGTPPKFDQGQIGGAPVATPEKSLKERYPSMHKK